MNPQTSPYASPDAAADFVSVNGRLNVTYRNGRYGLFPVAHCIVPRYPHRA